MVTVVGPGTVAVEKPPYLLLVCTMVTVDSGPFAFTVTTCATVVTPEVVVDVNVELNVVLPVATCEQAYEILDAGQPATTAGAATRAANLRAGTVEGAAVTVGAESYSGCSTGGNLKNSSLFPWRFFMCCVGNAALLVAVTHTVLAVLV
jgi:hypothetical protein